MIIENTKGISLSEIGIDVEQMGDAMGIACDNEILYPLINADIIKEVIKDSVFDFLFKQIEYNTDIMDKINVDTDFNLDMYLCYDFSRLKSTANDKTYIKLWLEYSNNVKKLMLDTFGWCDFDMMCIEVALEEADKDYLLKITADCLDRCFCGEFINVVS